MTRKPPKPKKCKACGVKFTPPLNRPLAVACSPACGIALTRHAPEEIEKIDKQHAKVWIRDKKRELVTTQDWLQLLQQVFNQWVKLRDKDQPCISCGTTKEDIQWAAGHFFSRGAYPNLRVNPDNAHKQCNNHCNLHLSGNLENYRPRLIERIGEERFAALEAIKNEPLKLTEPEIKELIAHYKAKIKELKKI